MTYSHNITAFALSLTFDLALIRFKVRPFKLLRTPSPHDHLPRLPFFCILSEQSRRFLLGAEQHNKRRVIAPLGVCEPGAVISCPSRLAFIQPFKVLVEIPSSRAALLRPISLAKFTDCTL